VVWAIGFGNTNGATISYNDVGPLPGSGGATVSFAAGHPNAIAHTGQGGGTLNIIGNFIHDTHPEDTSIPVIYLMATGTNATVANVVNNVCWNVGRQCIEADTRGPSYTVHAYNNTLLPRAGLVAMSSIHAPPQVGILYATNNLIISDTGLADVWDQEYSANNTVLTPAAAASDGFTVSNRWQPALGSSTLSAGVLISSVTTDILGTNRAVPFAVGAYEYTSSPAPEPPAAGRVGRVTANTVRAGR
jgi:hypothetical protein